MFVATYGGTQVAAVEQDAYRFLLVLENGGLRSSSVPHGSADVAGGRHFLAGKDLQRFRFLEIAPADESDLMARDFDAVWLVELSE